jgi:hypothetical protein
MLVKIGFYLAEGYAKDTYSNLMMPGKGSSSTIPSYDLLYSYCLIVIVGFVSMISKILLAANLAYVIF